MGVEVGAALEALIVEALELRFAGKLPVAPAAPTTVLDALIDTRARLDRIEELLGRCLRLRAVAAQTHAMAVATADDAWDVVIHRLRTAPVSAGANEYSTKGERHAEANLATLDLRHAVRTAAERLHHCDKAVDVIRLAHRGLDGVRSDLHTWLRSAAFESHLDR